MAKGIDNKQRQKLLEAFGNPKIEAFDFELIEHYFRKKNKSELHQVLNERTCNDIDFQECFAFIDRTHSRVGQQYLYYKLRNIPLVSEGASNDEKLIKAFLENQNFRLIVQAELSKLSDSDAYYISSLFQDKHLERPSWFVLMPFLAISSLLSILLMFIDLRFVFVFFAILLFNMGFHYWNKKNLMLYLSSVPQILKLNTISNKLYKFNSLQSLSPGLKPALNVLNSLKNRMLFFKLESKMQGEFQAFFWGIFELFKIVFLLEPLFLFSALKKLDKHRAEMEQLFCFVGKTDVLLSIASLRNGLKEYCHPQIIEKQSTLIAEDVYHPLIENCVKNSIDTNGKSILLTGSNMSGKTTFIRTIAINVICGLTLNTCFAAKFSLSNYQLYSAIRISDDLLNSKSYYFEEVLTIKKMIEQSRSGNNIFLLDEIFKGTNTIERIAAGKAVLSFLAKGNNLVFVSTHDIELANLLKGEFELYHFSEAIDNDQKTVSFDYKLKPGKLKNRNAIKILKVNDYPPEIINEAIKLAKTQE
ncbi:MAG: hypothetical protein WD048_13065 [Chitinophagales bacterium]